MLLIIYLNCIGDILNVIGLSDYFVVILEVNLKFIMLIKFFYKVYLYNNMNFDGLRDFMLKLLRGFFCIKF